MSRIGRKPIAVPTGRRDQDRRPDRTGQGSQGRAAATPSPSRSRSSAARTASCYVTRPNDERRAKELHGLSRTLVANMVVGVTDGLPQVAGDQRHRLPGPAEGHGPRVRARLLAPGHRAWRRTGITFTVERPTLFHIAGIDKQQVGEVAANIRKIRPPEPYKGKGVKYVGRDHSPQGRKGRQEVSATLLKRRSGVAAQRAVGRARRHFRVRKNVNGTAERPRLVVTRSLRHITAQVVDDTKGHTLVSASSLDATIRGAEGDKKAVAAKVGALDRRAGQGRRDQQGRLRPRRQPVRRADRLAGRRRARSRTRVLGRRRVDRYARSTAPGLRVR